MARDRLNDLWDKIKKIERDPSSGSHSDVWAAPDGRLWVWTAHFARLGDRLECIGLDVRAAPKRETPTGDEDAEPAPLTSTLMRQFPVGEWMSEGRQKKADDIRGWADLMPDDLSQLMEVHAREWEESRAGRPGPKGKGAEFYAKVARTYRKAVRTGQPPTKAVQFELGAKSKSGAAKWVKRARDMGLLEPARGIGKAG